MALTLAPSGDQPTITWGALSSGAAASTVISGSAGWFREKRQGVAETAAGASQTSTAALDIAGSTRYWYPALYDAIGFTANAGQYVFTDYKPGGSPQAARRLMNVEFVTSSPTVALRLNAPSTGPNHGRILVNGLPITDSPGSASGLTAGNGYYLKLVFGSAAARTITILGLNATEGRFGGVAVESGYTVAEPSSPPAPFIVLGDSYVNGASPVNNVNTFAYRVADALGYGRCFGGYGIGSTGFIADLSGQPTSSFDGRVSEILALNPAMVLIAGGRNDTATGLQAAVESLLTSLASVPCVVMPTASESTQAAVRTAIADACTAQGVPYLDVAIDSLPKLGDAIHPTLDGHKSLADAVVAAWPSEAPPQGAGSGAISWAGSATGDAPIGDDGWNPSPSRTHRIPAGSRSYTIPAGDRTFRIRRITDA